MTDPLYGFGAPDDLDGFGADPYYDPGFGDADYEGWAGAPPIFGFGDPDAGLIGATLAPVLAGDYSHVYPDDGGELVRLQAPWKLALPSGAVGPYRVRLVNAHTGAIYPDPSTVDGAYSARPGRGTACETGPGQTALLFALPLAPPGVYEVHVAFGPGFTTTIVAASTLRIIRRSRTLAEWRMRAACHPRDDAGPRSAASEDLQGA